MTLQLVIIMSLVLAYGSGRKSSFFWTSIYLGLLSVLLSPMAPMDLLVALQGSGIVLVFLGRVSVRDPNSTCDRLIADGHANVCLSISKSHGMPWNYFWILTSWTCDLRLIMEAIRQDDEVEMCDQINYSCPYFEFLISFSHGDPHKDIIITIMLTCLI